MEVVRAELEMALEGSPEFAEADQYMANGELCSISCDTHFRRSITCGCLVLPKFNGCFLFAERPKNDAN
jgi:hypothetical protein